MSFIVGDVSDCPVDGTISSTSATAFSIITASASVFPQTRKAITSSADLVDPSIVSIRTSLKMNFTLWCLFPESIPNQHNHESVPVSKSPKSSPESVISKSVPRNNFLMLAPENEVTGDVIPEPDTVKPAPATEFCLAPESSYKPIPAPEFCSEPALAQISHRSIPAPESVSTHEQAPESGPTPEIITSVLYFTSP